MDSNVSPKSLVSPGSSTQGTIPVAVYRQLASELQATRAMLEAVQKHNAQLTQQRDQLRSDLDRLAEAVTALRSTAAPQDAPRPIEAVPAPAPVAMPPAPSMAAMPSLNVPPNLVPPPIAGDPFQQAQEWSTLPDLEPADQLYGLPGEPQPTSFGGFNTSFGRSAPAGEGNSGVWPVVAIALIAATAFGISFALVRPILSNKQEPLQPAQPQIQPSPANPGAAPAKPR